MTELVFNQNLMEPTLVFPPSSAGGAAEMGQMKAASAAVTVAPSSLDRPVSLPTSAPARRSFAYARMIKNTVG